MIRLVRTNAVAWAGLFLALAPLRCEIRAQSDTSSPPVIAGADQHGVLVLQDGGVLVGQIARAGDRYVLTRANGEMQIAAANVMLVCGTLDEAYDQRRQQLTRPTADAHLALAEWCLRYNLVAQAGREVADARALEPQHRRLALLERRLALANERPRKPVATNSATRSQPQFVRQAHPAQALAADLPGDVVQRFTRKVQPVLVNNCTTSGCHQTGGAQRFQLDRALLRGLGNRRSTMHNLAETLALVDRDRPQLSPLLTVPRQTHGGMQEPVFGPRQETPFNHLVEWVALVTQSGPSEQGSSVEGGEDAQMIAADETSPPRLVSPVLRVPEMPTGDEVERTVHQETNSEKGGDAVQARYEAAVNELSSPPRLRFGARVEKWQPRDLFDPEIFNRQRSSPPAVGSAATNTTEVND